MYNTLLYKHDDTYYLTMSPRPSIANDLSLKKLHNNRQNNTPIILRFILSVRPCVCSGRSPEVARSWTKPAASLGHWRLEATERMPLCTLGKALTTGKDTSEFNVLDKNEIRVDTYLSERPDGKAAWFIGEWLVGVNARRPKTVFSSAMQRRSDTVTWLSPWMYSSVKNVIIPIHLYTLEM